MIASRLALAFALAAVLAVPASAADASPLGSSRRRLGEFFQNKGRGKGKKSKGNNIFDQPADDVKGKGYYAGRDELDDLIKQSKSVRIICLVAHCFYWTRSTPSSSA